jgi:hypothetical protein
MVGITKVFTNNTAAPRMSRILFTVFFSLLGKLDRDIFMSALWTVKSLRTFEVPEFVTLGVRQSPAFVTPAFVTPALVTPAFVTPAFVTPAFVTNDA